MTIFVTDKGFFVTIFVTDKGFFVTILVTDKGLSSSNRKRHSLTETQNNQIKRLMNFQN